jgi:hypothetical protein
VERIVVCREQATVDLENEIVSMARSGLHLVRAGAGPPLLVLHRQYPQLAQSNPFSLRFWLIRRASFIFGRTE